MKSLSYFQHLHDGETIIICGCGESVNALTDPEQFITIGVNDVGRRFDPTYLVVLNPRHQFKGDRFRYVKTSRAQAVFTQLDLGISHPNIVRLKLGKRGGADLSDPNTLPYTQNSPYVALCLAAHMGAKRIGLIGVDFTDHHFFGKTGRHVLNSQLSNIDQEYRNLAKGLLNAEIEVFNLSSQSKITAFQKIGLEDFGKLGGNGDSRQGLSISDERKNFFVNYKFLSCGNVFRTGLNHAVADLGIASAEAYWDDPNLPDKVRQFDPDLLFVVHGRKFARKWGQQFKTYNTAVWLLDEPYEVDDTSKFSANFDTVFVNDPSTLYRHRNAHYLPVGFDPHVYRTGAGQKNYAVGFIGGYNSVRQQFLEMLLQRNLLSYVIGGPWEGELQKVCLSGNIPAIRTVEYYRQTRIIINVFREVHHFNRQKISPFSLNPRIYEALACGAVVVSEERPELKEIFPELPVFKSGEDLIAQVQNYLKDEEDYLSTLSKCWPRLIKHTYAERLKSVLAVAIKANQKETVNLKKTEPVSLSHQKVRPLPFRRLPKRNLLFHIWPAKGRMWRWNLDELKKRIDIFNGRRVIGIVHDDKSERPDIVEKELDGHGCEFIVKSNNSVGESVTFPEMVQKVASCNTDEITFYAHAKGVKYEPKVPYAVQRWAEAMYCTNLDDWLSVRRHLEQFALTGSFKILGRFRNHQNLGSWHYSGTFFWIRNANVFYKDCLQIPQFYGAVEAWPGIHFKENETGCLFLDRLRQLPYHERFWVTTANSALKRWKSNIELIQPPDDLLRPLPFDGFDWPRTEQKPEELNWWIKLLLDNNVQRLLTIGGMDGGVEWHIARKFHEYRRHIEITTIDKTLSPDAEEAFKNVQERFGQSMRLVQGDSSSNGIKYKLSPYYDAVFIDGDHGYRGVRNDWLLARSKKAKLVGFHDIVDSNWHVQCRCCVSRLWSEIKAKYKTEEKMSDEWGGIGAVWPAE